MLNSPTNPVKDGEGSAATGESSKETAISPYDGATRVIDMRTKSGDVEAERNLEKRIRELGLHESKVYIESQLRSRIEEAMRRDTLIGALEQCKRCRPIRDRIMGATRAILNVIQYRIVANSFFEGTAGRSNVCQIKILMGMFTQNVEYSRLDERRVLVRGAAPVVGMKLTKEITVELPRDCDLDRVVTRYKAGVFFIESPYSRDTLPTDKWSPVKPLDYEPSSNQLAPLPADHVAQINGSSTERTEQRSGRTSLTHDILRETTDLELPSNTEPSDCKDRANDALCSVNTNLADSKFDLEKCDNDGQSLKLDTASSCADSSTQCLFSPDSASNALSVASSARGSPVPSKFFRGVLDDPEDEGFGGDDALVYL